MVMDLLRSCYKRPVRYVAGDPSQKVLATWYFTAPTAKAFPSFHAFGSQNWDSVHPTPTTLGDDANTKPIYYKGGRLNRSAGQEFAGPLEYFQNGAPAPAFLPRGFDGTPVSCLSPPFGKAGGGACVPVMLAQGGKLASGTAIPTVTPGVPCTNCSGITPALPILTVTGCTAPYTLFNGVWTLAQAFPCAWVYVISPGNQFTLVRGPAGLWEVTVFAGGPPIQNYVLNTSDCVTPVTLNFLVGPTPGFPATIGLSFA
jgi:hypothetical protein